MKLIYTFVLVIILTGNNISFGQSPNSFLNSAKSNLVQKADTSIDTSSEYGGPAPNNPWMVAGIQAGYNFNGGNFENNFQASGRAILEVLGKKSDKFNVFLMGNFTRITSQKDANNEQKIKELQMSTQGINLGVFPHWIFGNNDEGKPILTLYLPLSYKVNAFEGDHNGEKSTVYLNQFRVSTGAELSFLPGQLSKLPVTLSIEPTLTFFNKNDYLKIFNKNKSSLPSVEVTLILPAGIGRGIMFVYSTSPENTSQFMAGIILVGSQSEKD